VNALREFWQDARGGLAAVATASAALAWRHDAAQWVLEGLALVAGVLWLQSGE